MTQKIRPIATKVGSTSRRWLSPALFALIGIAFLLPFATVSCDGAKTTFSGIQLVTHTVPPGGNLAGDQESDCQTYIGRCVEHTSSNTATVALVAALLGLALGLSGIVRGPGWCALVGLGAMVILPFEGILGPQVKLHSGYTLAFWLFIAVWSLHVRRAWRRRKQRRRREGIRPAKVPGQHAAELSVIGEAASELEPSLSATSQSLGLR